MDDRVALSGRGDSASPRLRRGRARPVLLRDDADGASRAQGSHMGACLPGPT